MKIKVKNEQEIKDIGAIIGRNSYPNLVITMDGNLGAGKTTMTKGIAKGLGIKTIVNSPTFTILKVYQGLPLTLYHMDVYRITSSDEDFELEEYFESGGVTVIEWSQRIKDLLPKNILKITIEVHGDYRMLTIESDSNQNILKEIQNETNNN